MKKGKKSNTAKMNYAFGMPNYKREALIKAKECAPKEDQKTIRVPHPTIPKTWILKAEV